MDSQFLRPIEAICIVLPILVALAPPPSTLAHTDDVISSKSKISKVSKISLPEQVRGNQVSPSVLTSMSFTPPPDDGTPSTNQAGGRRDQVCLSPNPVPSLTLLMPPSNQGQTLVSHPTLWVYVPPVAAQTIFLKLEDEQGDYHFHTIFPISGYSGVLGLSTPITAPELEVGDRVKISLALTCAAVIDPSDPILEAWITRIAPPPESIHVPTHDISSIEQAQWYADNGVWFDALTILAMLRQEQPNSSDIHTVWETFLASVGLEALGGIDIVSPINSK